MPTEEYKAALQSTHIVRHREQMTNLAADLKKKTWAVLVIISLLAGGHVLVVDFFLLLQLLPQFEHFVFEQLPPLDVFIHQTLQLLRVS